MNLILNMAWRNIWRNKRRTLITMSSVVLAVIVSVVMRSMQRGTYDKMIHDVVGTYTGHVQIHARGYWDDKTLDNTFAVSDSLLDVLKDTHGVTNVVPRLESFALAAGADRSRGALIVGIDPEHENRLTGLKDRVTDGQYLTSTADGALVASGLASYLHLTVGDTLVLLGQGYHGVNAAGACTIRGLVTFASPEINKRFVYLNLARTQELFGTGPRLTSAALSVPRQRQADIVAATLRNELGTGIYEVMSWRELLPELMQQIKGDNAGGLIMLGILYLIVAFGIFGTILMMTSERQREFGVVNALGLGRDKLASMVFVETIMLAMLSALTGLVLALPIVWHFHSNPIRLTGEAAKGMINFGVEPVLPFALDPKLFLAQAGIVFIMTFVASLYPLLVLGKLNPIRAMHR